MDGFGNPSHSPRSSGRNSSMRGRPSFYGNRMVTVSFRIPESYATRIEEQSQRASESKSDFFRRAIDLALRDQGAAGDSELLEEPGESIEGQ